MLDVRKLVLLRELHARGSIAAAADALHYTRSAVSQQLTALEVEVGQPLLDRSGGKAALTLAGRLLVTHAEEILARVEQAEMELTALAGDVVGTLRVGLPFHEGPALLVPALTEVRREHPGLQVSLHAVPSGARQEVRLGRLDLALVTRYDQVPEPDTPGLYEEPLARDRIRLALAADHPLAATGSQPLSAFAADQWILNPASALGRLTLHACTGAGFTPTVVADSDDMQATLGLVALGWGVALVPDLVPDRPGYPVVRIRLDGPPLTRQLSLVVRTGALSCPPVVAVLTAVRRMTADLPGEPG